MWNYIEQGQGRPLILLHGIGMSHKAWLPIIPLLAKHRRVIAFDTAGFGKSPCLPDGITPTTINIVKQLRQVLHELGIDEPVDIVGNSMGGWMALEAGRLGIARSVVAISPAGLWKQPPNYVKHIFFNIRRFSRLAPSVVKSIMQVPLIRELLLTVPISVGSRIMSSEEAYTVAMDFAYAPGFQNTFTHATRFIDGKDITVPVTIAFGTKDFLLTRNAQLKDHLPSHTQWLSPKGWGHVPMWKDPHGVAKLILENTLD